MTSSIDSTFKHDYQIHLQHLRLKGLQPKIIEAYAHTIRRIGECFDHQLHNLSEAQFLILENETIVSSLMVASLLGAE
jgi:hypothetical protein